MSDAEKKSPKRTGRPPKNPELGKRINVMFRLNEAIRDKLMADAASAGRSMSEEIERRIDDSYRVKDIVEASVYSASMAATHGIFKTLGVAGLNPSQNLSTAVLIANILHTFQSRADLEFGGSKDWHKVKQKRDFVQAEFIENVPAIINLLVHALENPIQPE